MNHLPEIVLDDRRFQELVSEARTRIALSCPEWTEHNVSDPGITLIELFAWAPEVGDALYLGFDEDISDLLMRVEIDASVARGAGVDPNDPPLRWEVSDGNDGWSEAEVLEDRTGGFNFGAGVVELQCPPQSGVALLAGHRLRWLRCKISDRTRGGGAATYSHPPANYSIAARPNRAP